MGEVMDQSAKGRSNPLYSRVVKVTEGTGRGKKVERRMRNQPPCGSNSDSYFCFHTSYLLLLVDLQTIQFRRQWLDGWRPGDLPGIRADHSIVGILGYHYEIIGHSIAQAGDHAGYVRAEVLAGRVVARQNAPLYDVVIGVSGVGIASAGAPAQRDNAGKRRSGHRHAASKGFVNEDTCERGDDHAIDDEVFGIGFHIV